MAPNIWRKHKMTENLKKLAKLLPVVGLTIILLVGVASAGIFNYGDTVKTKASVNVRSGAGTSYSIIKTEPSGVTGTDDNTAEKYANGYYWTVIKYSDGIRGWSVISVPSWLQPAD